MKNKHYIKLLKKFNLLNMIARLFFKKIKCRSTIYLILLLKMMKLYLEIIFINLIHKAVYCLKKINYYKLCLKSDNNFILKITIFKNMEFEFLNMNFKVKFKKKFLLYFYMFLFII